MDGRRAQVLNRSVLDNLPTLTRPAKTPAERTAPGLPTGWAAVLGLGWPLAFMASLALEPTPAHPEESVPLLVELGSLALFVALVATTVLAARRLPAAAPAGVVAGFLAVTFSITCPLSGHHSFGLWWIGQLAVTTSMLALSGAALRHRSPTAGST